MPRSSRMPAALCLMLCCVWWSCFKKQGNDIVGAGDPLFTLAGKITDLDNGRVVKGAVAQIKALGLSDTVDAEGKYSFANLTVGTRVLDFSAPNYAPTTSTVLFAYEQRDVVQNVSMTKQLTIIFSGALPFPRASGIWWEKQQLIATKFDSMGGNLYRLDERLNVLQISPQIGTLMADTCFVRVDTCFWKQGICNRFIDPMNPFTPDSITTDSIFVDCQQRLYGLTRAEDFFYTTDGLGHFANALSLTPKHVFKVNPQTLATESTFTLNEALGGYALDLITDLAWDGSGVWLCNRGYNNFPKVNVSDFSPRAIWASPLSNATGLVWDGRFMWISSGTNVVQFDSNRGVRNHYKNALLSNAYLAWDGEALWAVNGGTNQIYKLKIPFEDHL